MFRGGRGGRGGGGAGSMGGHLLPFEVDTALESEIAAHREQQAAADNEADEWIRQMYPPLRIFPQPAPSAAERKLVAARRSHRITMRNGDLFVDAPKSGKRDRAAFNAFEDQSTFGARRTKRARGLPPLRSLPIVASFLPPELHSLLADTSLDSANGTTTTTTAKKNLAWLKKKRIDKLAAFDEGADLDALAAAAADDDDDDAPKNADDEGGEDDLAEPEDDDFDEDDDDMGNDYNAEKYFDDGEAGDDDGGGEEGGEEW